ncbi:MAG: phosphoribosyltransferase [Candidatus Saccharibacteria bacterium]|nr:phosphoribosyltransferase [Candidatus Saccharibacteria bacterium]
MSIDPQLYSELKREILDARVLEAGEMVAANGQLIGQKLEFDNVDQHSDLFYKIVAGLVELASSHDPDILIPVPEGANAYVKAMSEQMGNLEFVQLRKPEVETEPFALQSQRIGQLILRNKEKPFLVDDVFRTGSQLKRVMAMPEMQGKEIAAGVIWRRDDPDQTKRNTLKVYSLIHEYVPDFAERLE